MIKIKHDESKDEDILYIHDKIIRYFEEEKSKIDFYLESIKEMLKIISKVPIPYGIKNSQIEKINLFIERDYPPLSLYLINKDEKLTDDTLSYKQYLNYLESIISIHNHISNLFINESLYISESIAIIAQYKELIKTPIASSFMSGKKKIDEETVSQDGTDRLYKTIIQYNTKIQEMIENGHIFTNPTVVIRTKNQFFEPTKTKSKHSNDVYNTITISNNKKRKEVLPKRNKICECIQKEENKIMNQENNSQVVCAECGTIYNINFSENNNFYDYSRININQKYHYEKKCHFRDTINQYQGKQNKYIPEEIYTSLETILDQHGLLIKGETDRLKRFQKVTKEHIRIFLTETGYHKYYEDLHLIFSKLTGKPRRDISKYEKVLYEDFDKLVKTYLTLKLKRKNFLNSHYVLRQLLLRQGVKVPDNDLNCLKTQARLQEHDDIYQRCCEILNWNFTPMK